LSGDQPRTRLHVDDDLHEGAEVTGGGDLARRLGSVLRLAAGDAVRLFNGRNGEWAARIAELGRNRVTLTVGTRLRATEPSSDLWLLFAPLKGGRSDYVIEKATELGATRLVPVQTRRSDVPKVNGARLRANAVEAAEQCARLSVPEIAEMLPLSAVLSDWPASRALLLCAEHGAALPIESVARHLAGKPAAVLIGPEGGFDPAELDGLAKLPFVRAVGLGPRVLRADTAAFAALAVLQAVAGDWTDSGSERRPPNRD
jgi:16S rRNA (uracil1498-N3)-methyltransferase